MSYYTTIKGVRYAKDLLELAKELTSGKGDGRISVADIKQLVESAKDGPGITDTERRTLVYITRNFNVTAAALKWFRFEFIPAHHAEVLSKAPGAYKSLLQAQLDILPDDAITSKEELVKFLRVATQLELATIPLYLTSLYSIKPDRKDENDTYNYVFSIAVEEMLHLGLVSNILVGLGESAQLYVDPTTDPCSPFPVFGDSSFMPHRDPPLLLETGTLTYDRVQDIFMEVEVPESNNLTAFNAPTAKEAKIECDINYEYSSIGQLYNTIKAGVKDSYFSGDAAGQIPTSQSAYSAPRVSYFVPPTSEADSGKFQSVTDAATASIAMDTIIDQGEGASGEWADPDQKELAHYYKFQKIVDDQMIPADFTYNFKNNPKQADYAGNDKLSSLSLLFNGCYCYTLCLMEAIWGGDGGVQTKRLNELYTQMNGTLTPVARLLASQSLDATYNAAPTFEFYTFTATTLDDRKLELVSLANDAITAFAGDTDALVVLNQVLQLLSRTYQPNTDYNPKPGTFSWERDIRPLINRRDIGNMSGIHSISSYDDWVSGVDQFLGRLASTSMPPGGPYFTQEELDIIKGWAIEKNP